MYECDNSVNYTDPSIIIRSVIEPDFEQWLPLWHGYNVFYNRISFPMEITKTTWSRFLDVNEPVHALVAEKDGQLIGLANYLFHRSTTQINHVCYLQDLFTSEAVRGHGVGRLLIATVYKKAKKAGAPKVYWQTQENNVVARALYDKMATMSGFIVYNKPIE